MATLPNSPLADDLFAQIREGVDALSLRLNDETVHKLVRFIVLLSKWNQTYNLTAIRDPKDMVTHHVLDALAVVPFLDDVLATMPEAQAPHVLDVGAGGGVPGIILAVARPHWQVTLIDAVAKKMAFVTQAVIELKLNNAKALQQRVEAHLSTPPYDIVISRAFSSLTQFVELTRRCIAPTGVWAAMKGERPERELADLPADIHVAAIHPIFVPGLAGAERHLILMESKHD